MSFAYKIDCAILIRSLERVSLSRIPLQCAFYVWNEDVMCFACIWGMLGSDITEASLSLLR